MTTDYCVFIVNNVDCFCTGTVIILLKLRWNQQSLKLISVSTRVSEPA